MERKERYYTTQELMQTFRVSRVTIWRAVKNGELTVSKKEGRNNLFSEDVVNDYLQKNKER